MYTVDDKPDLSDLLHMSYADDEGGKHVHFRLMDRVKPHCKRLAIALKFPQHEIAIMEHKDDSVYYLLSEWLRGANKEKDLRPVTWGTLITALRDANIQHEADILENHFIGDESAHVAVSPKGEFIILLHGSLCSQSSASPVPMHMTVLI